MAENPFGQGGPEEEELSIEGNPIDTAEIDPQLAEAIASGEMTEMEDGSVEVGEFVDETVIEEEGIPFVLRVLHNFKHKLIKNYYQLADPLEFR